MQKAVEDRRQVHSEIVFPLTDCDGHKVGSERRSGRDRRKERRNSDIARNIINILH